MWPLDPSGGDDESGHRFGDLSSADHANLDHSPEPDESIRDESYAIPQSTRERVSLGEPYRRLDVNAIHDSELQVNSYPASERTISEVERGRICNAILPMPRARTLSAGDSINFDLAYSHAGQETCYVMGGDSVCVTLTEVIDAGVTDPATGQALFRLSWNPPGQGDSPSNVVKRDLKSRSTHGKA